MAVDVAVAVVVVVDGEFRELVQCPSLRTFLTFLLRPIEDEPGGANAT